MHTLSSPIAVKTKFGVLQATHIFHSITLVDRENENHLTSDFSLGVEVDGAVHELVESRQTCTFRGKELEDVLSALAPSVILAKHQALIAEADVAQSKETEERAAHLREQIAAAEEQLAALKAKRG